MKKYIIKTIKNKKQLKRLTKLGGKSLQDILEKLNNEECVITISKTDFEKLDESTKKIITERIALTNKILDKKAENSDKKATEEAAEESDKKASEESDKEANGEPTEKKKGRFTTLKGKFTRDNLAKNIKSKREAVSKFINAPIQEKKEKMKQKVDGVRKSGKKFISDFKNNSIFKKSQKNAVENPESNKPAKKEDDPSKYKLQTTSLGGKRSKRNKKQKRNITRCKNYKKLR